MLTPKQVAESLAVSTTAVYALCESGKLIHHRIGNGSKRQRIRIPEQALADYLVQTAVHVQLPEEKQERRHSAGAGYAFLRAAGWDG